MFNPERKRIAVIGSGVAGMSAAWLLNRHHDITVFEKEPRIGGHCNTVDVTLGEGDRRRTEPVDTGFIVYNEHTYPNLTAMFAHLDVATELSDMSFSASVDNGRFEYSGTNLLTMLAQKRNLVRPRFWVMVRDIVRFYGEAADDALRPENAALTLGHYLAGRGYSEAFLRDHLLPMGACIWSASLKDMREYPLPSFVRFFKNHGLLETSSKRRPPWRTVTGGSRAYVQRLTADFADRIRVSSPVVSIRRLPKAVEVTTVGGGVETFDDVVLATHSDQALALLRDPTDQERRLLSAIRYELNRAVLHTDRTFMPKRRRAWSSWNYVAATGHSDDQQVCLTYWMNLLQNIDRRFPLFVTLNPQRAPQPGTERAAFEYEHPIFDSQALEAQQELWSLQGRNRTWFCGAYFGHGFHEDGLQAGLAVGETLGGVRRPWDVREESGRIFLPPAIAAAA
ncbi:MAG: FAD-dependent oxidoreductase [Rhodospirillaceae bacterium]|nr:MAG: FAD-dependent oxidoreductase [Rhodospirillaceae bacterium]